VLHPREFQPHAGIYQWMNDHLFLISTDLKYPNGVCFSPGEKFLYVSSNHPEEPFLMKFAISDTGAADHGTVLANHNADGITTDHRGNLYLCTDEGIARLDATGKKTGFVPMPESPSNITWGGSGMDMLYITARTSIYRINPVFIR
jgi:gluconolactonase